MSAPWLSPVLAGLGLLMLGRAFYIVYFRRRGTRAAKVITWVVTVIVVGMWVWRFTHASNPLLG